MGRNDLIISLVGLGKAEQKRFDFFPYQVQIPPDPRP